MEAAWPSVRWLPPPGRNSGESEFELQLPQSQGLSY